METCVVTTSTAQLVEAFLAAKGAAGLSAATLRTYRQRLGYFVAWQGDRALDRPTLRAYLVHLAACDLAATSRASYFRDVSVFCSWLVDEGELDASPAQRLAPKVPKRLPASYRPEQIAALLAGCDARDRALIVLLLDTGLRASELCSLRRDSINWRDGSFLVVGKGNEARRGWVSPYARGVVLAYLCERLDDEPALWMGRKGPLTISGVHQLIERRAISAGIRGDVRRLIHAMRATFAQSYIKNGGSLDTLADLLGHSSLEMARHYAQLVDDDLALVVARVNPLAAILPEARDAG